MKSLDKLEVTNPLSGCFSIEKMELELLNIDLCICKLFENVIELA